MPIRRASAFIVPMLTVLAACTIERTPRAGLADPTGIARAEITSMLDGYERALVDANPRRIAAFFTPSARLFLPDTPDIHGRGAIDAAFTAMFRTEMPAAVEWTSETIDVAVGVAHQFGTFRQRIRGEDGTERELGGRFVIRWVPGPEPTWQIERMFINHVPIDSAVVSAR